MAESASTPESSETLRELHHYDVPRKEMHYLKKPRGYVSGMAQGNVGYQMAYSAKVLEEQLPLNARILESCSSSSFS